MEPSSRMCKTSFMLEGRAANASLQNFLCEQLNFWILSLFTWRATVPHAVFEEIWQSAKASLTQRQPEIIIRTIKAASPHLFNYSWYAAIAMTSLFISSTTLTEWISNGKYPKYRAYQRRVGMFLYVWQALRWGRACDANCFYVVDL